MPVCGVQESVRRVLSVGSCGGLVSNMGGRFLARHLVSKFSPFVIAYFCQHIVHSP